MGGLDRWFKEKWTLPNGKPCGSNKDKKNPQKCRPSKKISSKTPKTWSELSSKQKQAAIKDKQEANKNNNQFGKKRFSRLKKMVS